MNPWLLIPIIYFAGCFAVLGTLSEVEDDDPDTTPNWLLILAWPWFLLGALWHILDVASRGGLDQNDYTPGPPPVRTTMTAAVAAALLNGTDRHLFKNIATGESYLVADRLTITVVAGTILNLVFSSRGKPIFTMRPESPVQLGCMSLLVNGVTGSVDSLDKFTSFEISHADGLTLATFYGPKEPDPKFSDAKYILTLDRGPVPLMTSLTIDATFNVEIKLK